MTARWLLGDSTNAAFTDQNLPINLDLSAFDWRQFKLFGGEAEQIDPSQGYILIELNSLTKRSAPEPGTLALLGLGLAGLAASRQRKQ